ncbi:neural cell adhesion molecule 1-like [Glandiceps talaboti]
MNFKTVFILSVLWFHQSEAIGISPSEPKYLVGEEISITCTTDADPDDVRWYKGSTSGSELMDGMDRFGIQVKLPKESILTISNLVEEDEGLYICTTGGGQLSTTLEVFQSPQVQLTSDPTDPIIAPGNNITLTCNTNYLADVEWSKNGEDIKSRNNRIVIKDNVLTILESAITDAGIYRCIVNITDKLQRGDVLQAVDEVDIISLVDMSISNTASREEGESVFIECNATSYPLSTISWFKGNKKLEDQYDGRIFISMTEDDQQHLVYATLVIRRIETDDKGTYLCNASNSHSSVSEKFELDVLDGMEALYIFFGTMAEVIVLIIIILVVEKCGNKADK